MGHTYNISEQLNMCKKMIKISHFFNIISRKGFEIPESTWKRCDAPTYAEILKKRSYQPGGSPMKKIPKIETANGDFNVSRVIFTSNSSTKKSTTKKSILKPILKKSKNTPRQNSPVQQPIMEPVQKPLPLLFSPIHSTATPLIPIEV